MDQSVEAIAQPAGKRSVLLAAVMFIVVGSLIAMAPLFEHVTLYAIVAALGAMLIIPAWRDYNNGTLDYFEPVHVIGVAYFAFFGLGSIWTVHYPELVAYDRYVPPFIPQAAFYATLGYAAMLIGYYAPWRRTLKPRRYIEQMNGAAFVFLFGAVGLAGYFGMTTSSALVNLRGQFSVVVSSLGQLAPLFLVAWGIAWQMFFARRMTRGLRITHYGLLIPGAIAIVYLTVSSKLITMSLVGIPIIAYWYVRRRVRWDVLIALVLILIFVIFPFYNTIRLIDPYLDKRERLSLTYETVNQWSSERYLDRSVRLFMYRLAEVNSLAVVIRDVPRWVPYSRGETLISPLVFFIPRVLWPDKPKFLIGREFGVRFRLVGILDKRTSIAATVPGELYWNFDLPGILVGMFVFGIMMRFIYRRYRERPGFDPVPTAIMMFVLIEMMMTVGGHVAMAVTTCRTLILIEALRWLARHYGLLRAEAPGSDGGAVG